MKKTIETHKNKYNADSAIEVIQIFLTFKTSFPFLCYNCIISKIKTKEEIFVSLCQYPLKVIIFQDFTLTFILICDNLLKISVTKKSRVKKHEDF